MTFETQYDHNATADISTCRTPTFVERYFDHCITPAFISDNRDYGIGQFTKR